MSDDEMRGQRERLYGVLEGWLKENSSIPGEKGRDVAEFIVDSVCSDFPNGEKALRSHVPMHIFELVRNGLMSLPLAPEYELHCVSCEMCRRNYELVAPGRERKAESIEKFMRGNWTKHERKRGLYRDDLKRALTTSRRICIVAGEILADIYDDEMCGLIDAFAQCGNKFTIVAGPVIQSREDGDSPFLKMFEGRKDSNVELFVADRRQDLHFAFSDAEGLIYLEAYHEPADETRQSINGLDDPDPIFEQYARDRFEMTFSSPDVRLFASEDDVMLEDEERLKSLTKAARESGLDVFGKYGLMAQDKVVGLN